MYGLIQTEDADYPRFAVADPLIALDVMRRGDAMQYAKRNPRLLLEELSQTQANELATLYQQDRIPCSVIRPGQWVTLEPAWSVHNADCEDRFYVHLDHLSEQRTPIAWDQIQLISASPVMIDRTLPGTEASPFQLSTNQFTAAAGTDAINAPRRVQKKGKQLLLDLFVSGKKPHLRMAADSLNYDYLRDRLESSSERNFATFLRDLQSAAVRAKLTQPTLALLDGKSPEALEPVVFDQLNRWHLQRMAL